VRLRISGCYSDVRLHPVSGPLAANLHPQVLKGRFTKSRSREMTVTLPDGEVCNGTLITVRRSPTARPGTITDNDIVGSKSTEQLPACAAGDAANPQPPCDLASAWEAAYGLLFYEDLNLEARSIAQATLKGNKGTILHVETYRYCVHDFESGTSECELTGVAVDNKGNIYKVEVPFF
jgi:hypothetical protein